MSTNDEEEAIVLMEDADRRSYGAINTLAGISLMWKWIRNTHWTLQIIIILIITSIVSIIFTVIYMMINADDITRRNLLIRNLLIIAVSFALYLYSLENV